MSYSNTLTRGRIPTGELSRIEAMTRAEDYWEKLLQAEPATECDSTESEVMPDGRAPRRTGLPPWRFPWGPLAIPGALENSTTFKSIIAAIGMTLILGMAGIAKAQQETMPDHFEASYVEYNAARSTVRSKPARRVRSSGRRSGQSASGRQPSERPHPKQVIARR
jgi:hypothetical protein